MTEQLIHTFTQAYIEMGYTFEHAREIALQRAVQDDAARFIVNGCVDLKTAKEFVWLLQAAIALCSGSSGRSDAINLTQKAFDSLIKDREWVKANPRKG